MRDCILMKSRLEIGIKPALGMRCYLLDCDALLDIVCDIGCELLESGAETYRVEESVSRIVRAFAGMEASVFAVPTCVIVSITRTGGGSETKTRRIYARGTNLDRVERLNDLCRRICRGELEIGQARSALEEIRNQDAATPRRRMAGFILIAFGFTLFFGGGLSDSLCAAVIGVAAFFVCLVMQRLEANAVFINIVAGGVIMLLAVGAVSAGLAQNVDKIVIGTLMNLVPGVALTNAMRDIMAGDYLAGQTRMTEALLVATAIALGAGAALMLTRLF
ncbi:threonine/serine exporter family protein [Anaerotruncus colihominis]|uniref:threonine/serine exporter family protein n=1 Tax=Anaerotruncus colihominis TaxID=169435 RepID=UPI00242D09CC|nr:threonine/serine exporter family protein [Anaerotruncus colihominis]